MKVSLSRYGDLNKWENPNLVKFLLYLYGPVNLTKPFSDQRVRLDRNRKILHHLIVDPNVPVETVTTSFQERYDHLKNFKFELPLIASYLDNFYCEGVIYPKQYTVGVPYPGGPKIQFRLFEKDLMRIKEALNICMKELYDKYK